MRWEWGRGAVMMIGGCSQRDSSEMLQMGDPVLTMMGRFRGDEKCGEETG